MTKPGTDIKRILIVDDEPVIRMLCLRVLTGEGFQVDIAANGKEALSRLSEQEYELYLLDLRMPEIGGKELYELLQNKYPGSPARVVFTTGTFIGQENEPFLKNSGRPVLVKPFTTKELKTIVAQTIKALEK